MSLPVIVASAAFALVLAVSALPVQAQDKPFLAGGPTVTLAVTGTSAAVQVQATAASPALRIYNGGTVAIFLNCGVSGVTATVAAGLPIAPGSVEVLGGGQTYCAAISGGTAATLYITPGSGL